MNPPPPPANCPRCQATLPPDAPLGLCPRCLAAMNFATDTVFTGDGADLPAQPTLDPSELAPHFPQLEILECLGRGGMGVVYRARQKSLGRFVALKILAPERVRDPRFADRFEREAQALARLNHPSIVTIHDFGVAGGFYFLLMEYVDGVNLRQLLRSQRLSPEEALAIVPPLCEALQYAHVRGIVHRDIKPENLLLDREGRVKIADFGIARMLGAENVTTGLAETQPAGTPGYMAPEQRTTPTTVDSRADIYSLGVVLYEMLTGEAPGTPFQPPSRRVHIEVRLEEIVLRALEQSPELRFQTAAELRTEVEAAVAARRPSSELPSAPERTPNPQWVGTATGAVGAFGALLLVSIVAWSWLRATQATQSAEMARRQASVALQRAQAAEAFGANVTARPVSPDHFLLSGRLVDHDGNPMPNQQVWIVSPSYQPDLRHVPILEQLTTDAQGRFQTEVLHGRSWQVMRPKFPTRDGPRSRAITVNNTGVATADGVNIEVRDDGESVRVEVLNHPVE